MTLFPLGKVQRIDATAGGRMTLQGTGVEAERPRWSGGGTPHEKGRGAEVADFQGNGHVYTPENEGYQSNKLIDYQAFTYHNPQNGAPFPYGI